MRLRTASFTLLLSLITSCARNEAGGVRLQTRWVDTAGNDLTPPDLTLLYAWAELTFVSGGGETKTASPVWMGEDAAALWFSGLPYGPRMRLTVAIRAVTDPEHQEVVPEARPDNVVYYCVSQEFVLTRGEVTVVDNGCVMQKGAAWSAGGAGAPALRLFYQALATGELCVCELAQVIDLSVSATSHQLQQLRTLHLVRSRYEGKLVYYSLYDATVPELVERCAVGRAGAEPRP